MRNFKYIVKKNEYSLDINNCEDYKIAGACSLFDERFFKYYCAYWGIFSNWHSFENLENLRNKILAKLGLKLKKQCFNNIINSIKENIDNGSPLLLRVSTSSLFYSITYLNEESDYLGHMLLITGYDDEKKLIYIRENSINKEIISMLTDSNPLFQYQLTYEMLEDIINYNEKIIENYDENSLFILVQNNEFTIEQINHNFFLDLNKICNNFTDNLVLEVRRVLDNNCYSDKMMNEQFNRTYVHSLRAVFDILEDCSENLSEKFLQYKIYYMKERAKIINYLNKKSYKNNDIDFVRLNEIINKLENINKELIFILSRLMERKIKLNNEKLLNLLWIDDVRIEADSEKILESGVVFTVKNFLVKNNLTKSDDFWASTEETNEHWIKVYFPEQYRIYEIILEHSKYKDTMTSDYQILFSNDNEKWIEVINKLDNETSINNYKIDGIMAKYILFNISKPNKSFSKMAVIRNLRIYGI